MKKTKKHTLLLGAHISIAGGFYKAILRGEEIGCTAIQIFTKSNRQWGAKKITEAEAQFFKKTWKNSNIQSVVAHCTYLINLGSNKKDVYKKSKAAILTELKRCEQLGIHYFVLHPGSHLGSGVSKCLKQIAKGLDKILDEFDGKTKILLETMAGQGTGVGYKFEQIAAIFASMKHKRKLGGICLDTCHIFAAGYDFRTKKGYDFVMSELDRIIGLSKLKVIHINDSKKDLGTRVDRHEDIAKGKIGADAFRFIFNDERFFDIPKILETPEGTLENYAMNMKVIKKLLTQKTKKLLALK